MSGRDELDALGLVLGPLPLAIAFGAGAGARQAIGTTVVFGMLVATLIGVVYIPVFYVMLQRLSERRSPFSNEPLHAPQFVQRPARGPDERY